MSTDNPAGLSASPDTPAPNEIDPALADAGAGSDDELSPDQQRVFEETLEQQQQEADSDLAEMAVDDAEEGGLDKLVALVESTPPYRADATHFHIKLRLFPELNTSPVIEGFLARPSVPMEESRETLLMITIRDKGRTSGGAQRQQISLNDTPANARMFQAICEKVHCALQPGEPPRDYRLDEVFEGYDREQGRRVSKTVFQWLPGYIKDDFIYHVLDSRFRLVDAAGNIISEDAPKETYFALLEQRLFYVLQEIGSVQRKDGTWTPPRHRCLYVINEPTDKQRDRFKQSGFYMEQLVKDRQRSEQRSVKLRIMMALFDQMAERVYGMVVGTGVGEETRPLDVTKPADRQWIFGTYQKSALVPVFNNLMGVGGK